jgi:hypothetical protein
VRSVVPSAKQNQKDGKVKTTSILMLLVSSPIDVPKRQLKIAQRFNAGLLSGLGQVPKGRLKKGGAECVQSSLRDWNLMNDIPGVETPGYSRDVPSGPSSDVSHFRGSADLLERPRSEAECGRNCYERLLTPATTRIKNLR